MGKVEFNGRGEAEVVPTEEIGALIRNFSKRWVAERPTSFREMEIDVPESSIRPNKTVFMGPIDYLSTHTGIQPRQIARITSGELKMLSFSQAEKLLMAMDKEYLLSTGEISVVRNPNWSPEKWMEYMESRGCV
jgi:hypothetical protein